MKTPLVALRLLALLTLLTGVAYPGGVTVVARLVWPDQAAGSLITRGGRVVGSGLLAQRFRDPAYFWPRPSAGDDGARYATVPASASNLGPTSHRLLGLIRSRAAVLRQAGGLPDDAFVPPELLLASGSGLDPHLSPGAVRWQIPRVARARGLSASQVRDLERLIDHLIEGRSWGCLGEARVNVLRLNLQLPPRPGS